MVSVDLSQITDSDTCQCSHAGSSFCTKVVVDINISCGQIIPWLPFESPFPSETELIQLASSRQLIDQMGLQRELGVFPEDLVSNLAQALTAAWSGWVTVTLDYIIPIWGLMMH